jgi:hypothetical protein
MCSHQRKGAAGKETSDPSIPQPMAFIPPGDSSIPSARMAFWFGCRHELDSLSCLFTNSLSANNAAITDSAQKSFSRAQDRTCVKNGLTGGYKEYRWIMEHMGNAKNKAVYDSVKMKIQGR